MLPAVQRDQALKTWIGLHLLRPGLRASGHYLYLWICLAYLVLAIAFALMAVYLQRRFLAQVLTQIACDLAIISLLYVDGGGLRSGLAILYLFPLAGTAILAPDGAGAGRADHRHGAGHAGGAAGA